MDKLLPILLILSLSVSGLIYEAENSQEAKSFISDNPQQNRALMFYDAEQEDSSADLSAQVDRVMTLFAGTQKEGWMNEGDGINILRIDVADSANRDIVSEYNVKNTPLVVVLYNGNQIFEELVDENTDDHIRDVLYKYPRNPNGVLKDYLSYLDQRGYRPNTRPWKTTGAYSEGSIGRYPSYVYPQGVNSGSMMYIDSSGSSPASSIASGVPTLIYPSNDYNSYPQQGISTNPAMVYTPRNIKPYSSVIASKIPQMSGQTYAQAVYPDSVQVVYPDSAQGVLVTPPASATSASSSIASPVAKPATKSNYKTSSLGPSGYLFTDKPPTSSSATTIPVKSSAINSHPKPGNRF